MAGDKVRIDKWLWAVRLFKTRTLAADYCERGRVLLNNQEAKASRMVRTGDDIVIHRGPFHQHIRVIALTDKRMGAQLVKDFAEDITPEDEMEKFRLHKIALASFAVKGQGRPTKKDRRALDDFFDGEW